MLRNLVTKEIRGIKDAPCSAADLSSLIGSHMPYFNKLWEEGKENELYMKAVNLSEKKKKDYVKQQRAHFSLPMVCDKLSRVISSERNSRTYAKAEATKPESEILAELVTLRFRKIERDSNMEYAESEVFQSGVGVKYGVMEWVVEYDRHGNPKPIGKKRDYLDVMWDSNAREYDKSDGAFFAHRKKVYRLDIERDYGEKVAQNIEINSTTFGRPANENWGVSNQYGKRDFDVIYVYRIFVKVLRETFHVVFGTDDHITYSRQEAEEVERMLKVPYILDGQTIPRSEIVPIKEYGYDYYETTLNEILKYEETDLEAYPFGVYQAFQFEDQIWCMTDILKPINKLMDKFLAQIDQAIGADIKNGWEIVVSWLAEGYTYQQAIQKVKRGEPLPVMRPGAIRSIPYKGANPQWMEMLSVLDSMGDKYTGGDLFSGVQRGRQRESTESVRIKMQKQELIATLFIDNLRRWKRGFFTQGLWYLKKYDTAEAIQKVHGNSLTPEMIQLLRENQVYIPSEAGKGIGYVRLNNPENELTILKNADVDINIVEENISDTYKDSQYQRMISSEQYDPTLALSPTWRRLKLEKMDVSYEDRQKIEAEVEQIRNQQMAMAQQQRAEEMNLKKAEALIKDKGSVSEFYKNNE
ncbi:MAG: hypothetical protein WC998_05090 [Candidatus Paceibacterota bacterium]|jgi:hypothetical protein